MSVFDGDGMLILPKDSLKGSDPAKKKAQEAYDSENDLASRWLPSYSAWIKSTYGEDPVGSYRSVVHYSVDGHALCNERIGLVDEKLDSFSVKCTRCLKKLERLGKGEK